ncbi:hypothetical protein ACFQX6_66415 [Streptosporangium lutulentum]
MAVFDPPPGPTQMAPPGGGGMLGRVRAATKYALAEFSVADLLVIQLAAGALTLWIITLVRGYRPVRQLRRVAILALVEPAGSCALFGAGLLYSSASAGSIVANVEGWWSLWPGHSFSGSVYGRWGGSG